MELEVLVRRVHAIIGETEAHEQGIDAEQPLDTFGRWDEPAHTDQHWRLREHPP